MTMADLQKTIDQAWEGRDKLGFSTTGAVRDAVEAALEALDFGTARVAEKVDGEWRVNQWLKKAVLLSFRLNDIAPIPGGPTDPKLGAVAWWDKVRPSSRAGATTASAPPVSAPYPAPWCAVRPISPRA